MLNKSNLFLIILFESCSLFTDSKTIIGEFKSNDSTKIFIEKGEYLILEKIVDQKQVFDKLTINIQKSNVRISNAPLKETTDVISGEAIIINMSKGEFLIKNELIIVESKEYTISFIGNNTEKEYLIVNKE